MRHILIIIFIFMMFGCSAHNNAVVPCSDENLTCLELVTETTPTSELIGIIGGKETIESVNERAPILCLRKRGASYYAVYKVSDSEWDLVYFDSERIFEGVSIIRISDGVTKKDFDGIGSGSNINDVKAIDPHGNYDFMFASWSGYPRYSYHYTEDGYKIVIHYNAEYNIIDIDKNIL